ncbi:hypothetical protein FHR77_002577 [Frigoribacterium endophyticum]|nr:hypothetical protein [Frigoribacterium endophyticum]
MTATAINFRLGRKLENMHQDLRTTLHDLALGVPGVDHVYPTGRHELVRVTRNGTELHIGIRVGVAATHTAPTVARNVSLTTHAFLRRCIPDLLAHVSVTVASVGLRAE